MAGRLEQYEQLTAYLDGELSEAERAEVERLLEGDAEARALLEEIRRTAQLLGALPRERARTGLAADVTARLERSSLLDEGPSRRVSWWKPVALAASLLVICTVGFLQMERLQAYRERRVFELADNEGAVTARREGTAGNAQRPPRVSGSRVAAGNRAGDREAAHTVRAPSSEPPGAMLPAELSLESAGKKEVAIEPQSETSLAFRGNPAPAGDALSWGKDGSAPSESNMRAAVQVPAAPKLSLVERPAPAMLKAAPTSLPTSRPATSQPTSQPATSQPSGEKPRE